MSEANAEILAFNRGRVSPKALARTDIKRMAFSADTQTNLVPRVLGSMQFRPGMEYLFGTASNAVAEHIPFIYSTTDTALVEVTATGIRISVSDAIITRESVSTAITNGTFASDLTGWTDADEAGATSAWSSGFLSLIGTLFDAAIRRQQVSVSGMDQNVEHGVTFTILRGLVSIKIGSTSGGSEYITEKTLRSGTYSFVFTPTGDFHIEIAGRTQYTSYVTSVAVDASGDFTLPVPWGATDLPNLRWSPSADVVFIACDGYQQRRLERFDTTSKSWGISLYESDDGPFRGLNSTTTTLTPSALVGSTTLTASRALFTAEMIGALFAINSIGQKVSASLTGADQFTDDESMRIVGVGATRIFDVDITGTWAGTITLQRSIDEAGSWVDVTSWTANQDTTHDDGLDNSIAYYRIGFKTGEYTSGTAVVTLESSSGSKKGVVRVIGYSSPTSVSVDVLSNLGGLAASRDWQEGAWSTHRGFPSSVAFYEGRLWWAGRGRWWGSVSDAFDVFDEDTEGDSAPINRALGQGPIDLVHWLLPLQRLIAGTSGAEISARSTSFDEPLTPANFNLKDASTQGSHSVQALKIDSTGIFVQRGQTRIFELSFAPGSTALNFYDYSPTDLTDIFPEAGEPGIVAMAVQRQPDTRIHCVRSDGTVGMLIHEPINEVLCWIDIETDGLVEGVVVLPGTIEDKVYYRVNRTINGGTVRYLEKWALESEAVGGNVNKMADAFATFTNSPAASSIPAGTCSHLVAEEVVVWADGVCLNDANGDIATFTVAGDGSVAALTHNGASVDVTTGVVGLAYQGRFESVKLAYASQLGSALTQRKRLSHLGMLMQNVHAQGVKYGPDFTTMDDLPLIDDKGAAVDTDSVHSEYDKDMFEWPGGWGTDERMCLEMNAPRPATVLGVVMGIDETDKV
ncbi:MAG TPA: hypothetical protein VNA25_00975 [Phycisphaerae bacterium]|nr:hypothetical protein [Phycisphaerae bacterium]